MKSSIEKWVTEEDKALLPALTARNQTQNFADLYQLGGWEDRRKIVNKVAKKR